MEALLTTSFDRFARYSYTYRLRSELLRPSPLQVLDVGDPYGTLAAVFPDDDTVSVDLFAEATTRSPRHQHVIGSGFALPFPDGAFDLVTAHDVLEHVPADGRVDFIEELLRVSAGPVVVAAPFADPRTVACERIVNSYYVAHVGAPLQPLEEHAAEGLPDAAAITQHLESAGVDHLVYSDGWLFHWLAFMLLKAHYVSVGAAALDRATDAAFNHRLREVDRRPPHYRRAIILRPPPDAETVLGPATGQGVAQDDVSAEALEALAWDLVRVLPTGSDPADPDSDLHRWLREEVVGDDDDRRTVAASLRTALEEARANLPSVMVTVPAGEPPQERPSVTAVVLHRDGVSALAVAASLADMDEVEAVVHCGPSSASSSSSSSPKLRDLRMDGDDALHLAAAVADIDTEAMLVVDPSVGALPEQVRALIDGYDAVHLCVGFHRPTWATQPQAADLVVDGDDTLFVARELFLVQRELYSGVGGLDGRFRGCLDDVDLGLRLHLYGYAVRTVGPATWPAPPPGDVDGDTAVLWIWIKSFAASTLEQLLPPSLLTYLVEPRGRDADDVRDTVDFSVELESLFRGRLEGAQLRTVDDDTIRARFGDLRLRKGDDQGERPLLDLIQRTFERPGPSQDRRPRVLVLADDAALGRMRGLASGIGGVADVTIGGIRSVTDEPRDVVARLDDLAKQAEHAEVILLPARLVRDFAAVLQGWSGVVVVDLEEADRAGSDDGALDRGDVFICGSAAQREFWLPQLIRRGRGVRVDDQPDELIRVVLVSSGGVPAPDSRRRLGRRTVVVDLAGLPRDVPRVAEVLEGLRAAGPADALVLGDPDGRHAPILDGHRSALGEGTRVLTRPTARERVQALAEAGVVMRPVPDTAAGRLGPSTPSLDAVASRTPLVTTRADPVATMVERYTAGAVVADVAAVLIEETLRSVANTEFSTKRSVGADRLAWDLAAGSFLAGTLVPLVRRSWRWRWAHAGGAVPLEASPAVAALLAEREAQVTASVTSALAIELEREVRAAREASSEELRLLRARLAAAEDELNEVRHDAQRIRSHPLIRLALRARRAVRAR